MSLATFKKKSINAHSTATKISGKPTNEYWMYASPYGLPSTVASTIFYQGIQHHNQFPAGTADNAGFSINGPTRNIGYVGQNMKFSKTATRYRGAYAMGNGGNHGRYPDGPDNVVLNIQPTISGVANQAAYVKPSVLSTKGMLERRFRWAYTGTYPNYWVQPVYTGNLTDNVSQGLYIHDKSAANDCHFNVNNSAKYVDYFRLGGPTGCNRTAANGYKMVIQQSIAPYTKDLHQPKDASDQTLRVQRRCLHPLPYQKPFPYAVQNGTGVLRGGTSVTHVASSCHTSNYALVPPAWYIADKTRHIVKNHENVDIKDALIGLHVLEN